MSGSTSPVVTTPLGAASPGGTAIPAGQIVTVLPSVLSAGGNALDLVGLLLTQDTHIPLGQVYQFNDLLSVMSFFGPQGSVASLAGSYFLADINATRRPGQIKIACYHLNQWVSAKVLSRQMPGLTAPMLQNGYCQANSKFSITMDGVQRNSTVINFNTTNAGSLSMAAWVIGASLGYLGPVSPSTSQGVRRATATGRISGSAAAGWTLTVSANSNSVAIVAGDVVSGPNIPQGTYVAAAHPATTASLTGTFTLLNTANTALPVSTVDTAFQMYANPCTWDAATYQFIISTATNGSVGSYPANTPATNPATGPVPSITFPFTPTFNLVTQLGLTQASGGIINPLGNSYFAGGYPMYQPLPGQPSAAGGGANNISAYMDHILTVTQDWATFCTSFDPDGQDANGAPIGNAGKQYFAAWANGTQQKDNYMYVAWDNDVNATGQGSASANTLGNILAANLTSGTCPIYSPIVKPGSGIRNNGPYLATFVMGVIAALDFDRLNGRKTLAFKGQTGMHIDVIDGGIASNLELNNYNYYGEWSTANDHFEFMYPGTVSGPFKWVDSYINQIWINNGFQQALMVLLTQVGSIPYNQAGYTLIKAACQDVINKAVHFGAIRPGVSLSELQIAEVNVAAGVEIDGILNQVGWYLQVEDVTDTQVRAARKSPTCTFWYMDGGSVQRISLASIMVQ